MLPCPARCVRRTWWWSTSVTWRAWWPRQRWRTQCRCWHQVSGWCAPGLARWEAALLLQASAMLHYATLHCAIQTLPHMYSSSITRLGAQTLTFLEACANGMHQWHAHQQIACQGALSSEQSTLLSLALVAHLQVDPHAILDMQEEEGGGGQGGAAAAGPAADTAGSMAFLSHEPVASTSRQRRRPEAAAGSGGGSGSRGRSKLAAAWSQQHDTAADASTTSSTTGGDVQRPANGADHEQHGHHHHHHQDSQQQQQDHPGPLPARPHLHGSFHTLSITLQQPLSMAAFQQYVVQQLLPCRALTRAKGIVWMAERRADR